MCCDCSVRLVLIRVFEGSHMLVSAMTSRYGRGAGAVLPRLRGLFRVMSAEYCAEDIN